MRGLSASSTALVLVSSSFLPAVSTVVGGSGDGLADDNGDVSSSELDVSAMTGVCAGFLVLSGAACLVSIAWLAWLLGHTIGSSRIFPNLPQICPVAFVGARLLEYN